MHIAGCAARSGTLESRSRSRDEVDWQRTHLAMVKGGDNYETRNMPGEAICRLK